MNYHRCQCGGSTKGQVVGTRMRTSNWKVRGLYAALSVVVLVLGLASRRFGESLPPLLATYAGDTLWALFVYLGLSVVLTAFRPLKRAAWALGFAYVIEISQLYHAPWIDAVRNTTLGGLVLGFGFLWTDIVCYTVGVGLGVAIDETCTWLRRNVAS